MAVTSNSNLAGLSNKIALNTSSGKVQANPASLGISAPVSVGVKAVSPTTKATLPPTTLPVAQKAPIQPVSAPTTYDYNTGKPLAPGQAQSTYNSQTGQKIGEPAAVSSGNPPAPTYPGLMGAQIQAKDQQAQAAPQQAPTYSGLVGSLANNSLKQSPTAAQGAAGLINNAQTNYGTAGPAYQDYQKKVGELQTLKSGIAAQEGAIESQPIPLQFQQGREQALARQYASQLDAGQQAVNQAQQGIGFQLTGNSQQQAGLTSAAGIGNTAQGQLQSGLTSAASYAQPQLGSIGQVPFNPLDQGQGAVLGSTQPGGLGAAGQLLGQFQGAQALGAAPYGAQASNIQTQGTTATNIAAQGATQSVQAYNQMNAANTQFEGQASQLLSTLNQYQNNGTIPALNQPINRFSGALGSTAVSALNAAFAETQAAYTNLLSSSGGTPTSQDQQAIASLSINSTPQQIATSIQQLQAAAKIKLGAAQNLAQGYGSSLYGGGGQGAGGQTGVVQTKAGAVNTGW